MNNVMIKYVMVAVFSGLSLMGCAADCVVLCEEGILEGCNSVSVNCEELCSTGDKAAQKTGCETERAALLACGASGTVCSSESRCISEQFALNACVAAYCVQNPSDPDC